MTPQQIRAATPATERWVQQALQVLQVPALDSANNQYAYCLRLFELRLPRLAGVLIPLFARLPATPWWGAPPRMEVRK